MPQKLYFGSGFSVFYLSFSQLMGHAFSFFWIFSMACKRFEITWQVIFNSLASFSCVCVSSSSNNAGRLASSIVFNLSEHSLPSVLKSLFQKRLNQFSQVEFDGEFSQVSLNLQDNDLLQLHFFFQFKAKKETFP